MTTLCVLSPGTLGADGNRVQLDPKTVEGLRSYMDRWPGEVVFVARRTGAPTVNIGFEWPELASLPLQVLVTDDIESTVASLGSNTVSLLPLDMENRGLIQKDRSVLVSDYPLRVRWEFLRSGPSPGALPTARIGLGLARRGPVVRAMVRAAAGLQCNGPDTFAAYGAISRSPLQYFDTRVTTREHRKAEGRDQSRRCGPLRLGFSGRWIHQKGPQTAVRLVNRLRADGLDVTLTIMGGGPLETELNELAGDQIDFRGRLDFHDEWVPAVTDDVDVMILPHPQSDSSSTYLESISCGTPVVAYNNRYWKAFHAIHKSGWLVPLGDYEALVRSVTRLVSRTGEIDSARTKGLDWSRDHTFDREFQRRISHLRNCVQV